MRPAWTTPSSATTALACSHYDTGRTCRATHLSSWLTAAASSLAIMTRVKTHEPQRRSPCVSPQTAAPPDLVVGVLLTAATTLFTAAVTIGLLSVVSVLGSLSPVVTIALAQIFLYERLCRRQWVGAGSSSLVSCYSPCNTVARHSDESMELGPDLRDRAVVGEAPLAVESL